MPPRLSLCLPRAGSAEILHRCGTGRPRLGKCKVSGRSETYWVMRDSGTTTAALGEAQETTSDERMKPAVETVHDRFERVKSISGKRTWIGRFVMNEMNSLK